MIHNNNSSSIVMSKVVLRKESSDSIQRIDLEKLDNVPYYIESKKEKREKNSIIFK